MKGTVAKTLVERLLVGRLLDGDLVLERLVGNAIGGGVGLGADGTGVATLRDVRSPGREVEQVGDAGDVGEGRVWVQQQVVEVVERWVYGRRLPLGLVLDDRGDDDALVDFVLDAVETVRASTGEPEAGAVQVDVVSVAADHPREAARVAEVGGAVVRVALVDEAVVLGDPEDGLVQHLPVGSSPNVTLAFLGAEGLDAARRDDTASVL